MKKVFKMLVETKWEAETLLRKFDRINSPAMFKKTRNGKYVVTFQIAAL